MAEFVALGASIIAVIQAAERIHKVCKFFIENVDNYPSDLRLILIETSSLKAVFQSLEFIDKHDSDASTFLKELKEPGGPFAGCLESVLELEKLVPPGMLPTGTNSTKRRKTESLVNALAWPFKRDKARTLLNDISQYKSTISTAVSVEILQDVQTVKRDIKEVAQKLTDAERHEICSWLDYSDPSLNHNAACALYEAGTGDWVLRTDEWKAWRDKKYRCLWIYGIPGAGKTILAAHLTEELAKLVQTNPSTQPKPGTKVACVYYYCFHARNQDETIPFLRWSVSQLCRKAASIPIQVYDIFKLGTQPTLTQLLVSLEAVLQYFGAVFVTVDAVDESQQRQNLLDVLVDLANDPRFSKLQLLVTSRQYLDIKEVMSKISHPLSMSNPHVEADIERYVVAKVRSTYKFRRWPSWLCDEVQHTLAVGAKGMFRWAVCQLDILRRLNDIGKIRLALNDLPETLDDTYIRILSSIDEEDRPLLRHTLWMISFHSATYTSNKLRVTDNIILSSYTAFSTQDSSANTNHLYTPDALEEVCGCLVTFLHGDVAGMPRRFASLAHYTVREFVESGRSISSPVRYFHCQPDEMSRAMFSSVAQYALNTDVHTPIQAKDSDDPEMLLLDNLENYCQISAIVSLDPLESMIAGDKTLMARVSELLSPSDPRFSGRNQMLSAFFCAPSLHITGTDMKTTHFWDLGWISASTDRDINVLVNLLFGAYRIMSETLASTLHPRRLISAEISVAFEHRDSYANKITVQFGGTVIEFFAQCSKVLDLGALPVRLLYGRLVSELQPPSIDPTTVLAQYSGPHDHDGCEKAYDCVTIVEWLLSLGADPDAPGYPVTPLQIAVANRDVNCIHALLQAGASLNRWGDANGAGWDPGTLMGVLYNGLHGNSPLYIAQHYDAFGFWASRATEFNSIAKLLVEMGAESLSTTQGLGT
ncbi:hypothetical protein B0T16DRAFT_496113 [Cercophora newfieldiana]|uniref:Nephrocystin 3-like N-terminal domain-containing protein n=1 Tax=Cercophora newfieldiana TaxID=92897 RepID=A0AA39XWH3_9PEZI|nr:hypothetical protein B0T16DRAFT_496113 [Cercophora newfieldiana]